MVNCAVATCKNYYRKTGNKISYYTFPKDPSLRRAWVRSCKRGDNFNPKNARVCSIHFCEDDFDVNKSNGVSYNKPLKKTAVPHLHLPEIQRKQVKSVSNIKLTISPKHVNRKQSNDERENRYKRREIRQIRENARQHLKLLSPRKKNSEMNNLNINNVSEIDSIITNDENINKQDKTNSSQANCQKSITKLRNQIKHLQQTVRLQSRENILLRKRSSSNMACSKISTTKQKQKEVNAKVRGILKPIFTPGQINCLLRRGKLAKWNTEDISSALTLRVTSKEAYACLRQRGIPLPSPKALRRWTKQFKCKPGILQPVLAILKAKFQHQSSTDKLCVISFDEMSVDSKYCYDHGLDQVLGPHTTVQVAMAIGLTQNWRQPIFYDFETSMTVNILTKIIKSVQEAGFIVVGVTSDVTEKNQKTWKELGITLEKTWFMNPDYSEQKIWVFCDAPRLLTLWRDHFLDDGIILPDGTRVTKEMIEPFLAKVTEECRTCRRISNAHIAVSGCERLNIRFAVQLFSQQTAKDIRLFLKNDTIAKFFETMNECFDILNSRLLKVKDIDVIFNTMKMGFGRFFPYQNEALEKLKKLACDVRFGHKKRGLLPFQKGFIMTIESIRGLYSDIVKMGVTHFLTCRLNQDCLVNVLSSLRGYDNPTPAELRSRIRLLILSSNTIDIPESSRTSEIEEIREKRQEPEGDLPFVTCELLKDIADVKEIESGYRPINEEIELLNEKSNDLNICHNSSIDCPQQALPFIASYIAFKCRKWDKSLGMKIAMTTQDIPGCEWIQVLSRVSLKVPSAHWLDKIKQFEVMFAEFHGSSLSICEGVMTQLEDIIKKRFPDVHSKVINRYVRTRTFIRLRHLNKDLNAAKSATKKLRKRVQSKPS